jgi:hypothetical protein
MLMQIAKIIAGAALVAAPLSAIRSQSGAQPDSSSSHRGQWIAGAGAAGATLFMTFAQSGHSANTSELHTPQSGISAGPAIAPTDGSTPTYSPGIDTQSGSAPADTTGSTSTGDDSQDVFTEPPPSFGAPMGPMASEPDLPRDTSTVPEPGSLALTATGLIGLLPLIRRRRR